MFLEGAGIDAGGAIDLASGDDLILSAAQDIYEYRYRSHSSSFFGLFQNSSQGSKTKITNQGTQLVATGAIDLESTQGDLITAGAELESLTGDINLSATQGEIYAGAFTDVDRTETVSSSSIFFGLFTSDSTNLVDIRRSTGTSALAALDLTLVSGGDTSLIGAQLSAGRDLSLNVGGDLNIEAAIDSAQRDFFESKVGLILATTETEKSHRETAVVTSLTATGDIKFSVGGNTYLTLYNTPDENSASVADLYPEELEALAGLVLLDQELLDEYFYDSTTALSPAFTMVLTIALTSGFGSLLTNASVNGLTVTNAAGVTQLTHAGKAVASFAASTTVGIANGTVSGELDLGQILRSAALSAGTQFLTSSINLKAMGETQTAALQEASGNAAFAVVDELGTRTLLGTAWGEGLTTSVFGTNLTVAKLLEGGFDAALSAGIQSAATGADFGQSFKGSFINSVVALGLADAQTGIGGIFEDDANGGEGSLGHVLLHGLAGCVAAEAQGADCAAGAAGGIAGAVYSGMQKAPDVASFGGDSEAYDAAYATWRSTTLENAELVSLAAGFLFSGGKAENVSIATSVGTSAVANNYLTHEQLGALQSELQTCSGDADCNLEVVSKFTEISAEQQHQLAMCGRDINCMTPHLQAIAKARSHPLRAAMLASRGVRSTALQEFEYQVEVAYLGHTESLLGTGLFEGMFTSDYSAYFDYPEWAATNCGGLGGSACMEGFQQDIQNGLYGQGFGSGAQAFAFSVGIGAIAVVPAAALALRQCAANPICFSNLNLELTVALGEFTGATAGQATFAISTVGAVSGKLVLSHGDEILGIVDDFGRMFRPVSQTPDDVGRYFLQNSDGVKGYFSNNGDFVTNWTLTNTDFGDVADFFRTNGGLPKNFIKKDEAKKLGWNPKKGNLAYAPFRPH